MESIVKEPEAACFLHSRNAWKFTFFLIAVGIALLVASAVLGISTLRFLHNADFSEGTVEELELHARVCRPTVSFHDKQGQIHTFSERGSNPSGFKVGQKVCVAYNPNAPSIAHIVSFETLWILPTVLVIIGMAFVPLGLFRMWQTRKVAI
ncbi:MAG: DUF3592 domain-containing protein [Victivallaceae bacterium]|jgi:hypothetical protein